MALTDIKDAGILAGFERWGWPWHGLCEAGVIAGSGTVVPVPDTGHAWLIDKGLPPVSLSPGEAVAEAAANREWLNYGFISGGVVYGTRLPTLTYLSIREPAAFIHVDEAGENWLITLTGSSFPAAGVCRIFYSVVRFGHFEAGVGAQPSIDRTVDVPWTTTANDGAVHPGTYFMYASLQDVWTNGSKALVAVVAQINPGSDQREIFSLAELVFTGVGGADGSGLALAASEIRTREQLSPGNRVDNGPNAGDVLTQGDVYSGDITTGYGPAPVPDGSGCYHLISSGDWPVRWEGTMGFTGGYPIETGYLGSQTSCRFAFYDSTGTPRAIRLRWINRIDHWVTSWSEASSGSVVCPPSFGELLWTITVSVAGFNESGYELLIDDTVVDRIVKTSHRAGTQRYRHGFEEQTDGSLLSFQRFDSVVPYHETGVTWDTPAGSSISTAADFSPDSYDLLVAFRHASLHYSGTQTLDDGAIIGIHRTPNAAALFVNTPARHYGVVITQTGNQSTALTVPFYFSWNPKTGANAFSASPICWV